LSRPLSFGASAAVAVGFLSVVMVAAFGTTEQMVNPSSARPPAGPRSALAAGDLSFEQDFSGVHALQVELVTRPGEVALQEAQAAVGAAQAAVVRAQASVGAAQASLQAAQQTEADATAELTTAQEAQKVTGDIAIVASEATSAAAVTELRAARQVSSAVLRMRKLAVALYIGGGQAPPEQPSAYKSLHQAQTAFDKAIYVKDAIGTLTSDLLHVRSVHAADVGTHDADAAVLTSSAEGATQALTTLQATQAAVAQAAAAIPVAQNSVVAAQDGVAAAQNGVTAAQSTVASADSKIAAEAATVGPPSADSSPSILGPSVLNPQQLVEWFNAAGYDDETSVSVGQLADDYISEGDAEGVRGDIAFAQAVVETGGFNSQDAVELNNFAGIGHCDSCSEGLAFPTPELGIRAQIQLLRTWATATLTTSELAEPPVLAPLAPEDQADRGCCGTWESLTGVWASDPNYATKVLGMYSDILIYAIHRQ